MNEKYGSYLASREWALKKEAIKLRSGKICERCNSNKSNAVHHLTYENIYKEHLSDLLDVCTPCHEYLSGKSNVDPATALVYLAGKVGGNKLILAEDFNKKHIAKFVCSDGSNHSEHMWGGAYYTYSAYHSEVEEECLKLIRKCNLLLAYLDTPDSFGSIAEIAYASALRKRCIVVIKDDGGIQPSKMYDAYWFITSFPYVTTVLDTGDRDKVITDIMDSLLIPCNLKPKKVSY